MLKKVSESVSSAGTWLGNTGGFLLSGGFCKGNEVWTCFPWVVLAFWGGVIITIFTFLGCAACWGLQVWFLKKKIDEARTEGARRPWPVSVAQKVRDSSKTGLDLEVEEEEEEGDSWATPVRQRSSRVKR